MINERIDDLMRDGLKLIQNTDIFCFGMDAVLLSTYARAGKKDRVLDMGTGNGIIPVLMQSKNPGSIYSALEIQEAAHSLPEEMWSLIILRTESVLLRVILRKLPLYLGKLLLML